MERKKVLYSCLIVVSDIMGILVYDYQGSVWKRYESWFINENFEIHLDIFVNATKLVRDLLGKPCFVTATMMWFCLHLAHCIQHFRGNSPTYFRLPFSNTYDKTTTYIHVYVISCLKFRHYHTVIKWRQMYVNSSIT